MRNALPILLLVIAAAAGIWILLSAEEPAGLSEYDTDLVEGEDAPDLLEAPGLAGGGKAPSGDPKRRPAPRIDPRTIPRAPLDVLPVGPDLAPIPNHLLRVYVDSVGLKDWRRGLGRYDEETGIWTFPNVLVGDVEVRVFGDHVIEKKQKATVRKGQPSRVQIHMELAGAVSYHATLRDGTEPTEVTITLLDMNDKPVVAFHESRSARRVSQPRKHASSVQGSQGAVFGIPAGRYRLRVEHAEHGYQDAVVDIELEKTTKVKVELGR